MILFSGNKQSKSGPVSARSVIRMALTVCGAAFIAATISSAAQAQPASCDPAYWESMKQRGMLDFTLGFQHAALFH